MKIPKLRGINKIRDSKIISLWVTTSMTSQEIADKFELSAKRIEQIIYTNADLVKINKDQEKNMRILRLKKEIAQKKESKKDVADLMEQLRKEIEGDKPLIQQESHYHFTTVVEELHATATGTNDKAGTSKRDISSLES